MGAVPTPLQFAAVIGALVAPLAAGVAVVVWTKARAAARARRVEAMEGQLKDLYHTIASEPAPTRLAMVVEALEEGEQLAPAAAAVGKAKSAAGS
jgi:hypothetical protein